MANVSVHWIGGKKTFFKNFYKRENYHNSLVTKIVAKVVTSCIDIYGVTIMQVTIKVRIPVVIKVMQVMQTKVDSWNVFWTFGNKTNGTYWKISTSLECFIESITYIQAKLFVGMLCHQPLVCLPCCHCLHITGDLSNTFYENKKSIVA